jgi:protein arginine kinase activator
VTRCDHCGEREAVIHLTQVVDNTISTLHLCEQCAAAKGVDTSAPMSKFPLGEFLASLGKATSEDASAAGAEGACPGCGATLADFRRTGRLGCAACYGAFEAHLRDLLRRLHGTTEHAGERYRGAAAAPKAEAAAPDRLADLKERLRHAVEAERFEEAARLRDAIRGLE